MSRRAARVTVRGLVQGVGFRYFCRRKAIDSGLTGWVRNSPDGTVELWVEGSAEKLEQFITDIRRGPGSAQVEDVDIVFGECTEKFAKFEISH